jgi:hypothetical protein
VFDATVATRFDGGAGPAPPVKVGPEVTGINDGLLKSFGSLVAEVAERL